MKITLEIKHKGKKHRYQKLVSEKDLSAARYPNVMLVAHLCSVVNEVIAALGIKNIRIAPLRTDSEV
jgi:hypothetical protein